MNIDNKTKAAVLREIAEKLEVEYSKIDPDDLRDIANKLDPLQELIHPHGGCEGMVVEGMNTGEKTVFREYYKEYPGRFSIPREAAKLPAFLCDGTRPDWVKENDMVWFYTGSSVVLAGVIHWHLRKNEHFCVLDPVEVS